MLFQVWYANHYADRHGLSKLDITEKDVDGKFPLYLLRESNTFISQGKY